MCSRGVLSFSWSDATRDLHIFLLWVPNRLPVGFTNPILHITSPHPWFWCMIFGGAHEPPMFPSVALRGLAQKLSLDHPSTHAMLGSQPNQGADALPSACRADGTTDQRTGRGKRSLGIAPWVGFRIPMDLGYVV